MPLFYEAFIGGLDRAGNNVAVLPHRLFGNIPIPTYESGIEAHEVCKRLLEDESRRRNIE